jgi:methyl-accepting chemotaxis protein
MANWDLESEVPERERIDVIGQIAFAIEVLRQNAKRFKELEKIEAQHEARRHARQEQLEALVHSFEHSVVPLLDGVFESATQLHHTAERMKQSISVAQRNAGQVYESVGSSSQQIEAIAQSSDSIHRAIGEMVQRIHETLSMSNSALEETKDADQSTQELAQATRQISGVIALIRKITEKINLLALNAGIESIRAGEAGKGFVVVAQEVKTLATQTKRATEDIVDKIIFLQEKTASTEHALKQVRDGMLTLTETNQSLHSGIQDQQKLTNTIAYSMHQASGIMSGMDTSVGTINSKISDSDVASREVVDSARVLGSNANSLTHEIRKFLCEISAIDATLPADSAEDSTKAA